MTTATKLTGSICEFNIVRGFGFIKPVDTNSKADIFFHVKNLINRDTPLAVGDIVLYDEQNYIKGGISRVKASNIELLND